MIDSAIYEKNGCYYMFLKSEKNPAKIILLKSDSITGEYTRVGTILQISDEEYERLKVFRKLPSER